MISSSELKTTTNIEYEDEANTLEMYVMYGIYLSTEYAKDGDTPIDYVKSSNLMHIQMEMKKFLLVSVS